MTFDSNRAWKEATAAVAANRDVLWALAGVFFLLPSLAFGLFLPQPEPAAGTDQNAMMALVSEYYAKAWPFMLAVGVLQAIGTLALLTLLTDKARPTVGEAIRKGAAALLPLIGAQMLLALALGVVGGLVIGAAAASGSGPVTAVAVIVVLAAMIVIAVRTSLVAPVVAVEDERNPVRALQRSWWLTRGNGARLGVFYLLIVIGFVILVSLAIVLVGMVVLLGAGAETAKVVEAVVSAALGAAGTVYFVAILAAAHRQLAGPSGEAIGSIFE
ncbi:MAG: hypothetical protein M0R03_16105 [Novosphingobium sp.]|nr:hypothetical protein [Novosphingobium sp.]